MDLKRWLMALALAALLTAPIGFPRRPSQPSENRRLRNWRITTSRPTKAKVKARARAKARVAKKAEAKKAEAAFPG